MLALYIWTGKEWFALTHAFKRKHIESLQDVRRIEQSHGRCTLLVKGQLDDDCFGNIEGCQCRKAFERLT